MSPKTGTKSNPTMVRAFMHAGADEPDEHDDDRLYLQIEFMNDHALTLSWPLGPDGAPASGPFRKSTGFVATSTRAPDGIMPIGPPG